MTIYEFDLLDQKAKERVLWLKGRYYAGRHLGNIMYDVYKIDSFYVQLSYSLRKDQKGYIESFAKLSDIPFYLLLWFSNRSNFLPSSIDTTKDSAIDKDLNTWNQ